MPEAGTPVGNDNEQDQDCHELPPGDTEDPAKEQGGEKGFEALIENNDSAATCQVATTFDKAG